MFCEQCGKELKPGAAFCAYCGARVNTDRPASAPGMSAGAAAGRTSKVSGAATGRTPGTPAGAAAGVPEQRKNRKKKGRGGLIAALVIIVLLAGGGGAGGYLYFTGDSYQCAKQMKLAAEYLAEGDYEEALTCCEEALRLNNTLEEAYLSSADIYLAQEDYDSAVTILERGLRRTRSDEEIQESLREKLTEVYCDGADYHAASGDRDGAYALLEDGILLLGGGKLTEKKEALFGDGTSAPGESEAPEQPSADAQVPAPVQTSAPESPSEPDPDPEPPAEDTAIHRYELIAADVNWTQARQDCRDRGGYLVHINSKEEFDAIVEQIKQENKESLIFWLGAMRQDDSEEYRWVNGDGTMGAEVINGNPVYDGFWLDGEPSFESEGVQEQYLNMFYRSSADRFVWNDGPEDLIAAVSTYAGKIGYICEYED